MRQSIIFIFLSLPFLIKAQGVPSQIIMAPTPAPKVTVIGNAIREQKLVAEFYYYIDNSSTDTTSKAVKYDTTFAIRFRNYKYADENHFTTVEFNQVKVKSDSIYNAMKSAFNNKKRDSSSYSISFILNYGDIIQIKPYKNDNVYFCELGFKDAYIRFTEAEVDNLFHK